MFGGITAWHAPAKMRAASPSDMKPRGSTGRLHSIAMSPEFLPTRSPQRRDNAGATEELVGRRKRLPYNAATSLPAALNQLAVFDQHGHHALSAGEFAHA